MLESDDGFDKHERFLPSDNRRQPAQGTLRFTQALRLDDQPKAMDIATSIRGARVADHAQSQALFEELDRLHRDGAPWLLQRPDRDPHPLEWLKTLLTSHNSAPFVADVGVCVARVRARRDTGREQDL